MTHKGTGRTIPKTKRQEQAEIERQVRSFLERGGKVKELASEQMRPVRSPAFNPSDIGGQE